MLGVATATGLISAADETVGAMTADAVSLRVLLNVNALATSLAINAVLQVVLGTVLGVTATALYKLATKITGGFLLGFGSD